MCGYHTVNKSETNIIPNQYLVINALKNKTFRSITPFCVFQFNPSARQRKSIRLDGPNNRAQQNVNKQRSSFYWCTRNSSNDTGDTDWVINQDPTQSHFPSRLFYGTSCFLNWLQNKKTPKQEQNCKPGDIVPDSLPWVVSRGTLTSKWTRFLI